ncbi:hypothetical protein PVAND_000658 [Polypedilum vanderplanki]|uniref:Replication protein A subunit n=1 Tax=Polypedilum vanderplanki TaxID=319348 RepID=A0A9J6BKU2_POLVA|nr:hypothetical protein PVAND_000658 [Polypedilum vanderplanki]
MAKYLTKLSVGKLARIVQGEDCPCPLVFQVIGSKRVQSTSDAPDRCRLVLNDGVTQHGFAMLSANLNGRYANGEFDDYSIIRIDRFVPSRVNRNNPNDKNVIILFDIETLHSGKEVGEPISANSESLSSSSSSNSVPAPQKENVNTNTNSRYSTSANNPNTSLNLNSSMAGDLSEHLTMPIDSLSPYQNKWVIKARVTAKSSIRSWKNEKGEGKLFNVDLCDESGEIRCTGFRDSVDRFYDLLEIGKVYYISKCQLKPANKKYSKINNDYEMTMSSETQIQPCSDDTSSIPKIKYNLVSISDLAGKPKDDIVDVIGIAREIGQVTNIVARASGQQLTKREVTIADQTNASIVLTLWGAEAENFSGFDNPVVLAKNVRIGEYGGGKTLGTTVSSTVLVNPEMPEAHQLKGWYDNNASKCSFVGLSQRTAGPSSAYQWATFNDCLKKQFGIDKADYFQTMAMIHMIRIENMFYKACPSESCNKKVIDSGNGVYRCEKCNAESPNYSNRMLANVLLGDSTSNRWVTLFANVGEKLFGKNTDELVRIKENDKNEFDNLIQKILFKPQIYKLRTQTETYNDVPRNKITCVAVGETKIKDYNQHLLANIQRLTGICVDK